MSGETRRTKRKDSKGKIPFFFVGLLVGLGVSAAIFFLYKAITKENHYYTTVIVPADKQEIVIEDTSRIEENEMPVKETMSEEVADAESEDSLFWAALGDLDFPELEYEEVEFFIETDVQEEIFIFDQIIRSRRVVVADRSTDFDSLNRIIPSYHTFEIQQWSTPIRNSITYQRDRNILKIKGLDIDSVNIYYCNGNYYLQNRNASYKIPVNQAFERLPDKTLTF
ncbi:hypothetical protein LJC68_05740 [Bacteroidales bacterium OttesenSCG-928-B11]|nr:hypothetical protein [Bacteroidales bacterium OttesenSCG-928-B11]MDL2326596.1 hypothetical protein [Bacteroidales bacterium OttesenSCG-928-A14]